MEAMDWAEVKKRLLDGTSVQILADLNGVTYKTMYNRIMAHQVKDGVTYLTPRNTKGLKKAKAISKTKQAQAREKEKAAGIPEAPPVIVTNDYSCKGCAHCIQWSGGFLCKMGRECGENCVCSDYKTFPEPAPEKKPSAPEVVPDDKPLIIPFPDPEKDGLCPEVMEMLRDNFDACSKLAASYARQASDYAHLLKRYGVEIPETQKKKAEEIRRIFRR